jgi:hypothetical protein
MFMVMQKPLVGAKKCPFVGRGNPTIADEPVTARPLLLVVDDESPILKVVERLAAEARFEVVAAGDIRSALVQTDRAI